MKRQLHSVSEQGSEFDLLNCKWELDSKSVEDIGVAVEFLKTTLSYCFLQHIVVRSPQVVCIFVGCLTSQLHKRNHCQKML